MRRGTTPKHTFILPFQIPNGSDVRIVYSQNNAIIFERTTESCDIDGNTVCIRLTTEETLAFDCSDHHVGSRFEPYPVEIQVGVKTPEGESLWSDIITATVERCLREDGVI